MKINEVILEAWINLPDEERVKQNQAADQEFRALKGIDSPDSQRLADLFRAAYAVTGTVDSAYEKARADLARLKSREKSPDDDELPKKAPPSRYVSSYKGEKDPSMRKKSFQKKTQGDGAPGPDDPSGPGRGKYTKYKDGSDRAAAPKSKTQQAAQGIEKWASDSFGDLPGAGLVKGAYKLGKGAVNVATAPVRAVAKDLGKGYNFLRDPEAYSKFKQSKRK